jgi:hypothetical protein
LQKYEEETLAEIQNFQNFSRTLHEMFRDNASSQLFYALSLLEYIIFLM